MSNPSPIFIRTTEDHKAFWQIFPYIFNMLKTKTLTIACMQKINAGTTP